MGLQTSLSVSTRPSGATIYIDRRQTSHKTPHILQLDTDTQQQKQIVVVLKLTGYEIEVIDVGLRNNKLIELKNINNLPFDAVSLSKSKEFEDTNKIFEKPSKIDTHIEHFMNDEEIKKLAEELVNV